MKTGGVLCDKLRIFFLCGGRNLFGRVYARTVYWYRVRVNSLEEKRKRLCRRLRRRRSLSV